MPRVQMPDLSDMPGLEAGPDDMPTLVDAEDDGAEVDETGLDPDEIETVIAQANCSRAKAVKALRKHESIVDAILVSFCFIFHVASLTMPDRN